MDMWYGQCPNEGRRGKLGIGRTTNLSLCSNMHREEWREVEEW